MLNSVGGLLKTAKAFIFVSCVQKSIGLRFRRRKNAPTVL